MFFDIICVIVGVGLGYGFRGLISRELRSIAPTVKTDVALVLSDFKTEMAKVVADAQAAMAAVKAKL